MLDIFIAGVMLFALMLYAVTGGADFGAGFWNLVASGPRRARQKQLTRTAIAPIWEANHVWLILVVVLLFTAFPDAFATIMVVLTVPIHLMLFGIVLRGAAFTFRAYGIQSWRAQVLWEEIFALASTYTPFVLGVMLGAILSESVRLDPATGLPQGDYFSVWMQPFALGTGLLVLSMFAFLAAVYLTVEAEGEPDLQADFRARALAAGVGVGILAFGVLWLARSGAPRLFTGLVGHPWSLPFQAALAITAVGALGALWQRRYQVARALAIGQVGLMILGFGLAQYPYLVPPDLTILDAAAPSSVLLPLSIALGIGLVLLGPALWWLYAIFKVHRTVT